MLLQVDLTSIRTYIVFNVVSHTGLVQGLGPRRAQSVVLWLKCHSMSAWAHSNTKQAVYGHTTRKNLCVVLPRLLLMTMVNCRHDSLKVHVLQNGSRSTQSQLVSMPDVMQDAQL
jgi:hypothetical protein